MGGGINQCYQPPAGFGDYRRVKLRRFRKEINADRASLDFMVFIGPSFGLVLVNCFLEVFNLE